jgi:hypothetical protein
LGDAGGGAVQVLERLAHFGRQFAGLLLVAQGGAGAAVAPARKGLRRRAQRGKKLPKGLEALLGQIAFAAGQLRQVDDRGVEVPGKVVLLDGVEGVAGLGGYGAKEPDRFGRRGKRGVLGRVGRGRCFWLAGFGYQRRSFSFTRGKGAGPASAG